ncbi:hypothetical protein L4D00_15635 [Photobacterium swingsii]|uniref:Uncharacterized protein n=1 Tax=Photobacterium swingsii TaxID=680026 RepID=A0A0J8V760_9GAMM|nr:hypothetical protein [Photobacterium swingsii]KMV29258.1 hypothetical protein AB733_18645 [Photobacterium swingsii]PSW23089.1 hypothetical protein C9I94_18110 [Photobacterium swingsii]
MKKLLMPVLLVSVFSISAFASETETENTSNISPVICASAQLNKDSNNMDGSDAANYLSCKLNNMLQE